MSGDSTVAGWAKAAQPTKKEEKVIVETKKPSITDEKLQKEVDKLLKLNERLRDGIEKLYSTFAHKDLYSAVITSEAITRLLDNVKN